MQARVFARGLRVGSRGGAKAQAHLWIPPDSFELAEYHFYAALARAGSVDTPLLDAISG